MAISGLSNLYSNTNTDSKLGEMAAKLAIHSFDLNYATLLFFNTTVYYSVEVFLRVFRYNLVVNRGSFDPTIDNNTRQTVLFASDAADIEQLLDAIIDFEMDNTGKFIIVCESPVSNECDEHDVIELCWNYRMINIVFVKKEEKEIVGFTYFPLANGICPNLKPIKLDCYYQCANTTYGAVFDDKLRNFNLCPLTVSTFQQRPYMNITNGTTATGADGDLLRIIVKALNATLKLVTPIRGNGWGFRLDNGTWMGSLADIDADLANFSMTSAALTLTRFSDFQISYSYFTSKVVWVTHPAQIQNVAMKLLHPLSPDTRVCLVVSFLFVVLCAFIMKSGLCTLLCQQTAGVLPNKSIVFYAWLICMGQAVVKLPTKSSFLQMTLIWVWYCFLIRTMYQVYLISSLKGKFYEHQFVTLEDAINAKYPFGGGLALRDYYIDHPIVYDNWINVDPSEIMPIVLNMSEGMKFVLAMNFDTAQMVIKTSRMSLHILPQTIVTSPTVLFFKKYSSLSEPLNLILNRLVAGGFAEKLHQVYTSSQVLKHIDTEGETLKIVHFTACYAVLILGWILSLVFFSLEIYFGKIYQHPASCET